MSITEQALDVCLPLIEIKSKLLAIIVPNDYKETVSPQSISLYRINEDNVSYVAPQTCQNDSLLATPTV